MDVSPEVPLWSAAAESLPRGVVVIDAAAAVLVWNEAAVALLGARPTGSIETWAAGRSFTLPDGRPAGVPDHPLMRARRGERIEVFELQLESGSWIAGAASPLEIGGQTGALMIFEDVSAARKVRDALRVEREVLRRQAGRLSSLSRPDPPESPDRAADDATERFVESACQSTPAAGARLYVSDGDHLTCRSSAGVDEAPESLGRAAAWVVRHRKPLVVTDRADDPFAVPITDASGAYAAIPLVASQHVVGALLVFDDVPRGFDDDALAFLGALAARCAAVIERQRHLDELEQHREHLEALVRERTRALEESHRRLRVADRLASIGTLAAGLGHDMRNVLFPVRCQLDLVKRDALPDRYRETIDLIADAVEFLQQLCEGMRLFAGDADDLVVAGGETPIAEWASRAAPLLERVVTHGVTLAWDVDAEDATVAVASSGLTQAVMNLVINACEAMPDGGCVRIRIEEDGPDAVRVTVADEGAGMTADVRDRVFDPFYTTKARTTSTGLGLSVVHGVVAAAGGTIDVDSEPGCGTTITLRLPSRVEPTSVTEHGSPPEAIVTLPDERTTAWIRRMLTQHGYRVDGAAADPSTRLWVTAYDADDEQRFRSFVGADDGRWLICVGQAPEGFDTLERFIVVPVAGDLDAIRRAVAATERGARVGSAVEGDHGRDVAQGRDGGVDP